MKELNNYLSKKYYLFNHIKNIYDKLCVNYVDIGSSHNQNLLIKYLKNHLKIKTTNFDAFDTYDQNDILTNTHKKLVSDKKKVVNFYENFQAELSSVYPVSEKYRDLFKENFKGRKIKNATRLETISLDELNLKNVNMIKIDTQGYNYEIINGAKKTLSENFPIIVVEAWNIDIYKQEFNIGDQISKLKEIGYVLLDIEMSHNWDVSNNLKLYNSKKIFVGCEMIFIKEDLLFKNLIINSETMNNVLSLIIFLDIYGFKSLITKIIDNQEFLDHNLKNDLVNFFSRNSIKIINTLSRSKVIKYFFNKFFKFKIDGIFYHY
tara:strand:+ start:19307 stop:20266 length:960 start_codon:yes stop_codon:yes gene_type:complete